MSDGRDIHLLEDPTQELVSWAHTILAEAENPFEAQRSIVRRLGAHYSPEGTTFGFWIPHLIEDAVPAEQIYLEILIPPADLDLTADDHQATFTRQRVKLVLDGEFAWGVIAGLQPGTRAQVGDFYWLRYQDANGAWGTAHDHLAYSIPYGVRAPAELYDLETMHAQRPDRDHYQNLDIDPEPKHQHEDGIPRIGPPRNILQIHVGTASPEGTLAGLTRIYEAIAQKIRKGKSLTPDEEHYIAYEAVQLMPIEPPIEHEAGPYFWETIEENDESLTVQLRAHDIINWGYDVMISASPAPNPAVLESKRPDELVDFIATLHNFPNKPIKAMFDIVYGHTDNQALGLLNKYYLAGPNMYGQNMNYLHPVTRAILLEMQRRKHDYGADGIRVDGAQDFKWWDPGKWQMIHDDDYLREMNDIVQEVAGVQYRPWMIFEDGRPWPREDWELASSYREVTRQMPNVWQWGPLTFAHNTPFIFTFWISKWWRLREISEVGEKWITGCANHDTLRRGTQLPLKSRVNTYLGDTLPEIFKKGYDNPAAKMLDYCMLPGVPMDFLNAAMRSPWGFMRNTDERYGVKVVAEEARFTDWAIDEERFQQKHAFQQLKKMGFDNLEELRRFMHSMDHAVQITSYDVKSVVALLNATDPELPGGKWTERQLKDYSLRWMEDVHAYCNVSHYKDRQDPIQALFNRQVREFRLARPWLMHNLGEGEYFNYLYPTEGRVVFFGVRRSPDEREELLFIANMEGRPATIAPIMLPIPGLTAHGWELALAAPHVLGAEDATQMVSLHDSQAVVYQRTTP
ncbi:MAG: glucosylglycerol hydrolase [Anaerolineales bacterium]